MSQLQRPLPHGPFFERLAALEEHSARFRAVSAGLVTLRLYDAWVIEGPHVTEPDAWGRRAVHEAIGAMSSGDSTRALLAGVLESLDCAGTRACVSRVLPRLMAYGRALEFEGEWALAGDVYRTVIEHAHPVNDTDVVIRANLQLGASLRTLALWDGAWEAYGDAGEVAALSGDLINMLKARIGEANVATDRGNLPEAERILDQTIADAEQLGQKEVRALALHDRALTAHRRGDYEGAAAMLHLALRDSRSGVSRDRVLADLASVFFELGLRSAARDANLVLAATAQEQFTRWHATINLMELASADRQEPVFEQYRRDLAGATLPPILAAWYYFYVGQGFRMFDRLDQARISLARALEFARHHQLNQIAFLAEDALSALAAGEAPLVVAPSTVSTIVAEAADGVRRLRESVGIAE